MLSFLVFSVSACCLFVGVGTLHGWATVGVKAGLNIGRSGLYMEASARDCERRRGRNRR